VRTRISRLALTAGAVGLSLALFAGPAGAAQPKQSLGQAGSDTTYFMMQLIKTHYMASSSNTNHDIITEIPPVNVDPFPTSVTVPADGVHPAMTWDSSSAASTPPNGSSAGITALENDKSGQIAFGRASRGPNPGETAKINFWAFALGAVDYVTFPGSDAPAKGLTQAQMIGIYTCNPATGQPFFSDWSQVGGKPGGIVRYAPQAGSGTLSFFQTKMLNGGTVDANCDSSHLATRLEEHDARGVSSVTFQNAIYMYDWGKFRAQKTGFEHNLTNGAVLGKYGTTSATIMGPSTSNVNETKSRYNATRYVFNVQLKVSHPASDKFQVNDITRLIGVRTAANGGPQYICSGKAKNDIIKAGFEPLTKFNTGGIGLGQSFCRLDPTAL
jgi:phosphate transport system substrate-binding protein